MCLHTGRVDPYIYVIDGFDRFYVTVAPPSIQSVTIQSNEGGAKIKKRNHHVPCRMQRTTDTERLNNDINHSRFWFSHHIYMYCIYHHCCSAEYCNSDIVGCVLEEKIRVTEKMKLVRVPLRESVKMGPGRLPPLAATHLCIHCDICTYKISIIYIHIHAVPTQLFRV
jgi:hypothetical protein